MVNIQVHRCDPPPLVCACVYQTSPKPLKGREGRREKVHGRKNQGAKEEETNKQKIKRKGLGKHPNPERVKKTGIPFGATHDPIGSPHMLVTAPVAVPYPILPSKKRTRKVLVFILGWGASFHYALAPHTSPLPTLSIAGGLELCKCTTLEESNLERRRHE